MPTMKEINEGYFNYLVNEIFKALDEANDYSCIDFCLLKVELMMNLHKLLQTKESFDEKIKILSLYERNKK